MPVSRERAVLSSLINSSMSLLSTPDFLILLKYSDQYTVIRIPREDKFKLYLFIR